MNTSFWNHSVGVQTLFKKEISRFWKVAVQTVAAPVLTALLYLLIFSHVLSNHVTVYGGIDYVSFLVPGLVMMSVLQNAFANSSSSLIQSKMTGNLIFILLPPLSHWNFFVAYVSAAVVRGLAVGFGIFAVAGIYYQGAVYNPLWIFLFAILGGVLLGSLGIVAGLWADKFDQIAAFQNFIITPATFLSGVFYSVHSLPSFWLKVSHLNPFFYIIDGFRYGFFGQSDVSPYLSLSVLCASTLLVSSTSIVLLKRGYKIRS